MAEAKSMSVSYDFTVKRYSNTVVKVIFWVTFALFLLSVSTQWLTSWFGWQAPEHLAEWMYRTFSVDPGRVWLEPWTLVTHMFMHGGTLHFTMNMLMLYMFYRSCKEFFPNKTWLIVYFAAGIAGGMLYALLNKPGSLAVGASGGIMGLWGAAIAARIRYRYVPADERPWQCDMTLKSLLVFLALQAVTEMLIPNVAHSAHAGGMIVGFAIAMFLPLQQQPRVVAGRGGAFSLSAKFQDSHLGQMVSQITITPEGDFDPSRDFLAVEYDQVDWRNRRSVSYEVLLGTIPGAINEAGLVFVASARQVGNDTALEFARKLAKAEGKPEPEDESKKLKVRSYAVTAMFVVYFLLGDAMATTKYLPLIAVVAAVTAGYMWYRILRDMLGEVKKPLRVVGFAAAVSVVVLGGGLTIAWLCGDFAFGVHLLVSLAAGHVIQRYIILPFQIRRAEKSLA